MKTSFVCAALLLLGLTSMSQAEKPKADTTTKKKEFVGHVTIMKGKVAPPNSGSDGLPVQTDNNDAAQTTAETSTSPSTTTTSELQIGTCRSCSGACSQCSPPKCACADISAKSTGGMDAQSPATSIDTGMTPQPAAGAVKPGYNVKANKKM